jgi:uncharacterized cupredoxin-like copper-binding protein
MSDEAPAVEDHPTANSPATSGTVVPADEATPVAPDNSGHPSLPAEPVTFRSKFLMPLLVPLGVTAMIIFYVLNVSRVFLANRSALAVTFAAIITVLILAGGSALAASPRLRSSSITLMLDGAFLVLLVAGLISIGASSPKTATGPVQCAPVKQKLTIDAGVGNALRFSPSEVTVKTGCVQVRMDIITSTHTLQFDDATAANAFPQLTANQKAWAGTLPPGKYRFHCTIPGHEQAGMVGHLTVTP